MTKIFIEAKSNKTSEYHFLQAIISKFLPAIEVEFIFMDGIGNLYNETNLNQIKLAQETDEQVIVFADADTGIEPTEHIHVIRLPENYGPLSPILHVVPLQLLAYHIGQQLIELYVVGIPCLGKPFYEVVNVFFVGVISIICCDA